MKLKRMVAVALTLVLCLSAIVPGLTAMAAPAGTSAFAAEFADPTSNDAKPGIRYWFSPGRMNEAQTRKEIRSFAEMGYGSVELISLEQTTVQMNSREWNDVMYWILDEAVKVGIQIDVTLGEFWPIATEAITDAHNDPAAEQQLNVIAQDFTAAEDNMTYTTETWLNDSHTASGGWGQPPQTIYDGFHPAHKFKLVAVTAAKKNDDGTYDPETAVVLTDKVNTETGAAEWTAPSEGNWSIFWAYQQNTGNVLAYGVDATVVDHLSKDGTQAVINDFEQGFTKYKEETGIDLKALYRAAGGDFFGDSFELSSCTMWTWDFLKEFKERRGYDLTPYIATVWNSSSYNDASAARTYEFDGIGEKVRNDYGLTVSELIAENHLAVFNQWAETLGMSLRYQVHSSSGALLIDETVGALATDTPETESYALGNSLDAYRSKSAAATMMNSKYGAEAAAEGGMFDGMAWIQTWTGSTGTKTDSGLLHFTNRLFAGGVNKLTLHGATYQLTGELTGVMGDQFTVSFPGYSLMQGMGYPNDWANSTPLYEYSEEMLSYLTRTQLVLQQGQADMDLAVYRLFTTPSSRKAEPYDINLSGYTFEYVTDAILSMDNAVVGQQDGRTVLAPNGPSYKALIIDQRTTISGSEAFAMSEAAAKTILGYAQAGLPVVLVGKAPSTGAGLKDLDENVAAIMAQLDTLAIHATSFDGVEAALRANGITPDADPAEAGTTMFYHRETRDEDFYFLANDSATDADTITLTLKGNGRPYVLNAWSGKIEPVAEYTRNNGTVTLNVTLEPQEQALIAVAPNGWFGTRATACSAVSTTADSLFYAGQDLLARTSANGSYTVTTNSGKTVGFTAAAPETASIESWTMVLHEWLPVNEDNPTVDPWNHQVKDTKSYTLANTDADLVGWYKIDADNLGDSMGVAEYTTTVTLSKGWKEGQGAVLNFKDVSDTMGLTVNGHEVPVNQLTKDADIGPWLVSGKNTIVVKVSSAAGNYVDCPLWGSIIPVYQDYGILGEVALETYTVTTIYDASVVSGIISTVISGAASAEPSFLFLDVSENAWYYDAVKEAWENDLIDGVTATRFEPEKTLTVAEAIKLAAALHQMVNEGEVTLKNSTGSWYDSYVDYAVKNGIIEAKYADYTLAQMNAAISREEFVHIFYGAMAESSYAAWNTVAANAIPDVKSGDSYADEIYTFYRAGILVGSDARGTFRPTDTIKRSEVATILIRMYDDTARESMTLG